MKKRILAALMVLSMMLTGLGYVPVQAAGNGLTVTETEPVLPFHEIAEKDQLASAQNPDEIVEIIVELEEAPISETCSYVLGGAGKATAQQAVANAQAGLRLDQAAVQRSLDRNQGVTGMEYTRSYMVLWLKRPAKILTPSGIRLVWKRRMWRPAISSRKSRRLRPACNRSWREPVPIIPAQV